MDLLRGLHTAPWLVSLARGLAGAILAALLLFLGDATNLIAIPPQWAWVVPVAILALRQLEGALDQADPLKSSEGHAVAGRPVVNAAGQPQPPPAG